MATLLKEVGDEKEQKEIDDVKEQKEVDDEKEQRESETRGVITSISKQDFEIPMPTAEIPYTRSISSLTIPPFFTNYPDLWFVQVEALFLINGITCEATRFAYIVSSLPYNVIQKVRDLLVAPPNSVSYATLKEELIKRTSISQEERFNQLLFGEKLEDQKPSQLLHHMRYLLADNTMSKEFFKELFFAKLPAKTKMILVVFKNQQSVEKLAEVADRIEEITSSASTVTKVATKLPATSCLSPYNSKPEKEDLQKEALPIQIQPLEIDRVKYRSSSESSCSSSLSKSVDWKCWYHRKFGSNARHCVQPCSFSPKNNTRYYW